jgi:hypothetical protein
VNIYCGEVFKKKINFFIFNYCKKKNCPSDAFFYIKKEKKNYFSIIKKKLLLALKKGVFILHWNLNKMFLYYYFYLFY